MEKRLNEILLFWFGDSEDQREVIAQKGRLWFGKDPQVDVRIAQSFGDLVEMAIGGRMEHLDLSPRHRLAEILLLDQFPRNIYRGDPRSFAGDPLARERANALLAVGADDLRPVEKVFLYLPFEHSEDLNDQKKSVALFHQLREGVSVSLKRSFSGFYDYAVRHCEIIDRFGRFPHRNEILGRESTAVESNFLRQPGSSF